MSQMRKTLLLCAALAAKAFALPAAEPCSEVELVIARGTTEPLAPDFGVVVGDPLYEAVKKLLPGATGYKVDYPASFDPGSLNAGRDDVIKHMAEQSKRCPNQKYVMVGYSQGGDVMHNALLKVESALFPRIVALVMFGDPGNKGPKAMSPLNCKNPVPVFAPELAQKLRQNCEKGDPVCTNDGTIIDAHLVYSDPVKGYMEQSAKYIQQQLQSGGKAGPQPSPNVGTGDNLAALLELGQVLGAPKGSNNGCSLAITGPK